MAQASVQDCSQLASSLNTRVDCSSNQINTETILKKTDNLIEKIQNMLKEQEICFEAQEELAKQIALLHRFEDRVLKESNISSQRLILFESKLKSIEVAINSVFQKGAKYQTLAESIRHNVEYYLDEEGKFSRWLRTPLRRIMHLSSTPLKVLFGLAVALPIYMGIPLLFFANFDSIHKYFFGDTIENLQTNNPPQKSPSESTSSQQNSQLDESQTSLIISVSANSQPDESIINFRKNHFFLVLVACAGSLGSIISILTRIEDYNEKKYSNAFLPIVIGAVKPLIGTFFGILSFTIISSGILIVIQLPEKEAVETATGTTGFFFFSIAFAAGFSERFARDIVSRAEGMLPSTSQDSKKTASS